MSIKLYGFPISNFYNRIRYVLLYKGIPFEEVRIDPKSQDPHWKSISPMAKIPVLEDDGFTITESLAIAEYLEERFPEPALFGKNRKERTQIRELTLWMDNYFDGGARPCYDFAFRGKEPVATTIEAGYNLCRKAVDALRKKATLQPFLISDSFTFADVTAHVHLRLAAETFEKLGKPNLWSDWAEMREYLDRIDALEVSKKVISARRAVLRAQSMGERARG